ncbi:hypothetical protein Taro_014429 [Colocasia esculenta]|uniref:Secreted protein n=1 Tax=Colocasia esculenta TaxID=4460 RepID=A0A843U924_COLES|nr:hypothetical protein [Colocasia esculenta]
MCGWFSGVSRVAVGNCVLCRVLPATDEVCWWLQPCSFWMAFSAVRARFGIARHLWSCRSVWARHVWLERAISFQLCAPPVCLEPVG